MILEICRALSPDCPCMSVEEARSELKFIFYALFFFFKGLIEKKIY